jgi:hypothetical protein
MTYANRPGVVEPVVAATDYHDRVRWGPIFAGLVIALVSQLVLSAFGAAIGLTTIAGANAPNAAAGDVGTAVGIWTIISLLISLFLGSWVMARSCGPMNRNTGLLNGAILWATTLALSAWLLTSGVSGLFGIVASNAGEIIDQVQPPGGVDVPSPGAANTTPEQTRDIAGNAAKAGWSFVIGSLLSLAASLIGASAGTRTPRTATYVER